MRVAKWDRSIGRPEPIRSLNRIVEVECGEPLVHLNEACPGVVIMRPSVIPYLRDTVASMVAAAAKSLGSSYKLGVIDAWRPFDRQVKIYQWMWNNLEEAQPGLPYAVARRKVCRFVAPVDQKAPPGHCTGGAVDVNLLTPEGEIADTISPFGKLQGAPTHVFGLAPQARENRMRLYEAMMGAGFSNCRDEWWHYSFGDAGYAVRMQQDTCRYGRIDMPEEIYRDAMDAHEARLREIGNPFL